MIHTFVLTILLLDPRGLPSTPVLPTEHKSMKACLEEMRATYAQPMGKWRIVGARCEVKR